MAKVIEFSWPLLGIVIPCILIAFGGYGTYFFILVPHHDSKNQLILHQFFISMLWLSYFIACTKNPGKPAIDYQPQPGEWKRWCIKCDNWKPERTHHCRKCKQCVLRMDHHCPWTYNCVGHGNLPQFMRFLIWVLIASGYSFYHVVLRAIALYKSRHLPAYMVPKSEVIMTVLLIPVLFFILFTISLLALRVLINVFNGQTQIEVWELERIGSLVRRGLVQNVEFPYDIDPITNFMDAWGEPWTWFWPWANARGDGMRFEKNESADDGAVWPPDHRDQSPPPLDSRRRLASETPTLGYESSNARHRPNVPEWRRNISRDEDFFRSDQWENFEGERLSDFGVDMETVSPSGDYYRDNPDEDITSRTTSRASLRSNSNDRTNDSHDSDDENVPLGRKYLNH